MENNNSHEIKLLDRCLIEITSVTKILSFDASEFLIETGMGVIHVSGCSLELLNLDTINGCIKIKGKITGINYIDKNVKKKEESFISKLFK